MKLLALDTSTEVMAVAVCHGDQVALHQGEGGALASAHLVPQALALLAQAGLTPRTLDAIAFGRGPGAFTGLRTAVSVAQGLAFGADRPVLPIDSLLVLAEDARAQGALDGGAGCVWVAIDARMDEVYAAAYRWSGSAWSEAVPPCLTDPAGLQALWQRHGGPTDLAGNAATVFGERLALPAGVRGWPQVQDRAAALLALARRAWADGQACPPDQALPVYLRDKVALTTAERQALKAEPRA